MIFFVKGKYILYEYITLNLVSYSSKLAVILYSNLISQTLSNTRIQNNFFNILELCYDLKEKKSRVTWIKADNCFTFALHSDTNLSLKSGLSLFTWKIA